MELLSRGQTLTSTFIAKNETFLRKRGEGTLA